MTTDKYILSAFADEYSDSFDEQIVALKKHDIGYVELRRADGKNVSEFTAADVRNISEKLAGNGIAVSSIGSPIGKIRLDGDISAHFDMAKRVFDTANALETKNVRIFSFYARDGRKISDDKQLVCDCIGKLLDIADGFGVRLCHENEALIYGESPQKCLELLDLFGGRLRCVFDAGNFVLDGFEPMQAYELLKNHIQYFHIKDSLYAGAVVPAGKGQARLAEILCKHADFVTEKVFVTLEPHLQTFDGLNALVGKTFENPYKYSTQQAAFDDDVENFKKILSGEKQ